MYFDDALGEIAYLERLRNFLHPLGILDHTTLSPSGRLIVIGDVTIPIAATSIKFPFESTSGSFFCANTAITSLVGAPHTVGGGFNCSNTKITSLNGAPQSVGGSFYCHGTKIKSLKGIHKTHRNWKIGGILYLPDDCADIVGLALIEGISRVRIATSNVSGLAIIFDISDHDPHSFQEKLLDLGMKYQARM